MGHLCILQPARGVGVQRILGDISNNLEWDKGGLPKFLTDETGDANFFFFTY